MAVLPASKLTMGLPFYSRDVRTGHWVRVLLCLPRVAVKDSLPEQVSVNTMHRCSGVNACHVASKLVLCVVLHAYGKRG